MNVTYIERVPGNWRLRVEGPRKGDGTRTFSYETVKGTEEDARRRRFEITKAHEEGSWSKPDKLTLAAFLARWVDEREAMGRISRNSAEYYRRLIAGRVLPTLGGARLQRLTGADLQALYASLLTGENAMAASSVVVIHRILTAAFKSARKARLITLNPIDEVDAPSPGRKTAPKALDEAQLEKLARAMAGHPHENLLLFALATGMRRGELSGLRWRDYDPSRRQVTVAGQNLQYDDGSIEWRAPKTDAAIRTISLPQDIADMLVQMRAAAAREALSAGRSIEDYSIFSPGGGRPFPPDCLTTNFRRLAAKAGLVGYTLHGTRHTHITALLKRVGKEGAKAVSRRVGHANVNFTLSVYQSVFEEDDRDLADLAGGMIRRGGR